MEDELDYCPDLAFMDSKPAVLGILKGSMEVYSTKKGEDDDYQAAG